MRTLRFSLVGLLAFTVLGYPVVALGADTTSEWVTPFTGTVVSQTTDTSEEEWWAEPANVGHARSFRLTETVEWSDPRLPATKQDVLNFDMYRIGEFREVPIAGTMLLKDSDGHWTGEFTTFCDVDGDCYGMNSITGHGAYEGLFAVFRAFDAIEGPEAGDFRFEGIIFEGEMPPLPDAIEPPVE